MAMALSMGIISHCYYDEGVISKKFQFILKFILGTRNLFEINEKSPKLQKEEEPLPLITSGAKQSPKFNENIEEEYK